MKTNLRIGKHKVGLEELIFTIGQPMNMVEIGSYQGASSEIFAKNLPVSKITCVDPWVNGYDDNDGSSWKNPMDEVESQFDKRMSNFKNVTKMKMTSQEAVKEFEDNSLDFVYIDGLHTYDGVKNDITWWKSKIKEGGFLAGHDWGHRRYPGVKKAVLELLGEPNKLFKDTSWLISL
jgi:hypothetical protein